MKLLTILNEQLATAKVKANELFLPVPVKREALRVHVLAFTHRLAEKTLLAAEFEVPETIVETVRMQARNHHDEIDFEIHISTLTDRGNKTYHQLELTYCLKTHKFKVIETQRINCTVTNQTHVNAVLIQAALTTAILLNDVEAFGLTTFNELAKDLTTYKDEFSNPAIMDIEDIENMIRTEVERIETEEYTKYFNNLPEVLTNGSTFTLVDADVDNNKIHRITLQKDCKLSAKSLHVTSKNGDGWRTYNPDDKTNKTCSTKEIIKYAAKHNMFYTPSIEE